jgi:TRAP transporter 4TM/12TM fusion protein
MADFDTGRGQATKIVPSLIAGIAVLASLFHLYTAGIGLLSPLDQRGIHLLLMLVLAFLIYKMKAGSQRLHWVDLLLILFAVLSNGFLLLTWEDYTGVMLPSMKDVVFGFMLIIAILEAARRTTGMALPITALVFLGYAFWGHYLPGMLGHKYISLERTISFLYETPEGIFGLPIAISATFLVLYILFGAFLSNTGAGRFFVDLAFSLAGSRRGGAAKVAVVSSALMGTITGSPLVEVATTGTLTIPLMKNYGYKAHVAGAIEAVAATGGMIMPPVMGAVAFLIAENLGISYFDVAKAAALPAILYYACLYFMVDFEAVKNGLVGLEKEKLPSLIRTLVQGWYALIPLIALISWISIGWSVMRAGFWSIILLLATAFIARKIDSWKTIYLSLKQGAEGSVSIAAACACAGIILGVIGVTGLGVKLTSFMISFSGGNLFIGLILTAITSLILGMGLPAVPIYVMMSAINAPALIQLGAQPLAAHLFLFYFGAISAITPPVALAAYAAAGVAGASPSQTGWRAFWYGISAYIMPFMFMYSPSLLMEGGFLLVVGTFISGLAGAFFLSAAIQGYLIFQTNWLGRVVLFAAGLCLIHPGGVTDLIGIILAGTIGLPQWFRRRALNRSAGESSGTPIG